MFSELFVARDIETFTERIKDEKYRKKCMDSWTQSRTLSLLAAIIFGGSIFMLSAAALFSNDVDAMTMGGFSGLAFVYSFVKCMHFDTLLRTAALHTSLEERLTKIEQETAEREAATAS